MRFPDLPALTSRRRLLWLALAVTVLVGLILCIQDARGLQISYGDTDDATRIVLARQLLQGRGWWDQHELVLQPPVGVYMHWSRLLDGGIALLERGFGVFVSAADAEAATRLIWPLLWIFPAVISALLIARRLGEESERPSWPVFATAILLPAGIPLGLFYQFHPGRVDHHDAQIVLFLLAFAGAVQRGPKRWGPAVAGIASGLGLAIGLEALVFEAAIGAAFALRFAVAAKDDRALELYGAGMLGATVLAFLIQTPPERWGAPACDALAINLVAGVAVAAAGLIAVGALTRTRGVGVRLSALAGVGVLAAGVYLGLDRNCLRGPFADVDPRIKPFWLDYVQEVQPFLRLLKRHPDEAASTAAAPVLAFLAWAWLGRRKATRGDFAWRLAGALLLMTSAAGFVMVRAAGYAAWVAVPIIATGAADLALRYRRFGLVAPLLAVLTLAPLTVTGLALAAANTAGDAGRALTHKPAPKKAAPNPPDYCFNSKSYADLAAARPVGLTVGDIDFGPFVLALTPHATLSAPYHRMNWGIMAARGVLTADADADGPEGAQAKARALHVTYVLECQVHNINADRVGLDANSLQAMLDRGDWPDWLELISAESAPIRVFRVRPAGAGR